MTELIHQFRDPVYSADGVPYVVQAWAEREARWHGWLVFIAADGRILRTARESTHRTRDAVRVWAAGLDLRALSRALARAVPPSASLPAA